MARTVTGRLSVAPDRAIGDALVEDHPAGSTVLYVSDTFGFDEAGGELRLGEQVLTYTGYDDDNASIFLDVATESDALEGDAVVRLPEVFEKSVQVRIADDSGSRAVDVRVPFYMHAMVDEAIRTSLDEPYARLRYVDGDYELVDIYGIQKKVDAGALTGPLPQDVIDDSNLPGADLTELYEQLDALAAELADVLPITESKIADNAITTPKLVANAVTTLKLAAEAVTAEKLFVDQAMVTKLVAKMIEVEALNAQVITGIQIVGGSISIAQGVASTLDQDFETASGTTPPSGWTRTVVGSAGTAGDVDFQTSGGNPGRWLRLRSPQITAAGGTAPNRIAYPTALSAQDVIVEFDYRWTGAQVTDAFNIPEMGVLLRANPANPGDPNFATGVRVFFVNGMWRVITGSGDIASATSAVPINTVARVRIILRGATLTIQVGTQEPTRLALNIAPTAGPVVFRSYLNTFFGATSVDQTMMVDNVHIEVLQTGLQVARDGKTTVEYLQVNQAAVVPDPILPTDAVTKRYVDLRRLDQAAAPLSPVALNSQRITAVGTPTAGTDAATKAYVDSAGAKAYQPVTLPGVSPFTDSGSDPSALTLTRIGNVVYASGTLYRPSGTSTTFTNATDVIPVGLRPAVAVDWLAPTYNIWNTTSMWGFRIPISGGNAWRAQIRTTAGPGTTGMPMVTFSWVTNDSPTGLTPA